MSRAAATPTRASALTPNLAAEDAGSVVWAGGAPVGELMAVVLKPVGIEGMGCGMTKVDVDEGPGAGYSGSPAE